MHRIPHTCRDEAAFQRLRGLTYQAIREGAPVGMVLMSGPEDDDESPEGPIFVMLMSPDSHALAYLLMNVQAHEEMIKRLNRLYELPHGADPSIQEVPHD